VSLGKNQTGSSIENPDLLGKPEPRDACAKGVDRGIGVKKLKMENLFSTTTFRW